MTITRSKYPALQVPSSAAGDVRVFLEAVKERLEIATGDRGDPRDRLLTVRDIEAAGIASVTVKSKFATLSGGVSADTVSALMATTTGGGDVGNFDNVTISALDQIEEGFLESAHDFIAWNNSLARLQRVPYDTLRQTFLSEDSDAELTGYVSFQNEDFGFEIRAEVPRLRMIEVPTASETLVEDSTVWDLSVDAGVLGLDLVPGDGTGSSVTSVRMLEFVRTGQAPSHVSLFAPLRVTAATGHLDVTPSAAATFAALTVRNAAAAEIWRLNSEVDGDLDFARQSGAGLLRLNGVSVVDAGLFTTGTLDDARLSANVPLKNTTNTFALVNTFTLTPVVPNSSWTYAKIQNVSATARVLGRVSALAGVIEELTAAQVATLITYTAADVFAKVLTLDGAGSGLDADLLDGVSSSGYATTAQLALKLDISSYTAADVLTKVKTVDGAGSGLDADLLDGLSSAAFAPVVHTHVIADVTGLTAALTAKLDAASYTAADVFAKVLTLDGPGSGLDADTLDGISSAGFLATGAYTAADVLAKLITVDGAGSGLDADLLDGVSSAGYATTAQLALKLDSASYTAADVLTKVKTVDGAGSGLDADLLDGLSSAAFAPVVHTHVIADVTGLTAALTAKLDASSYTAADVLAKLITVDGVGSGIDADLLDGVSSAGYATTAQLALKLDIASYTAADVFAKVLTLDGAGSLLDADFLDGLSSAAFLQTSTYQALAPTWSAIHTFSLVPVVPAASFTYAKLQNVSATARVLGRVTAGAGVIEELTAAQVATLITYTAADVLAKLVTVDGAGSGLDADLLDGVSSSGYATTAQLALKLDSASYTAADVLAKLLTVDGAGTGLDADLLDGLSSAAFAPAVHTHVIADVTGLSAALTAKLDVVSYTAADVFAKVLTLDGAGSTLDADLLDAQQGSYYLTASNLTGTLSDARLSSNVPLKNAANVFTAVQSITAASGINIQPTGAGSWVPIIIKDQAGASIWWVQSTQATGDLYFNRQAGTGTLVSNAGLAVTAGAVTVPDASFTYAKLQNVSATARVLGRVTAGAGVIEELTAAQVATLITYTAADVFAKVLTLDGSGSGLDADLLDGVSSSGYATTAQLALKLDSASYTAADVLAKLLTVDGAGTGLDADLLDGLSSAAFAPAVHTHVMADVTDLAAAMALKLDAASYTAADVFAKVLTLDGAGSGLDADTLDTLSSAAFLQTSSYQALTPTWSAAHTFSLTPTVPNTSWAYAKLQNVSATARVLGRVTAGAGVIEELTAAQVAALITYTAADVLAKLLTVDGAGSGIDADTLDTLSSAAFLQTSSYQALTPTWSAAHIFSLTPTVPNTSFTYAKIQNVSATSRVLGRVTAGAGVIEELTGAQIATLAGYTAADVLTKLLTVDGAGTGLDADLLDGVSSAGYATAAGLALKLDSSAYTAADVLAKLITVDGAGSGIDADLLDGLASTAFALVVHTHVMADVTDLAAAMALKLNASSYTAADVLTKLLTVDGAGSGIDADTLDALSSAAFLQTSSYQALTPTWSAAHTFSLTPTVPNSSWTYAKIQNVSATARVLGRNTAGAGVIEELTGAQVAALVPNTSFTYAKLQNVSATARVLGRVTAGAGVIEELTAAQVATLITYTAADVLTKLLTVDGAGSGLDADTLNALASTAFLQTSTYQALTPTWSGRHIFSGSWSGPNTEAVLFSSAFPVVSWNETGAAVDNRRWAIYPISEQLNFATQNDAMSAGAPFMLVDRTGTTVDQVNLLATTVRFDCTTLRLNTSTGVGASGILGYLVVNVNGTSCKIPYYGL